MTHPVTAGPGPANPGQPIPPFTEPGDPPPGSQPDPDPGPNDPPDPPIIEPPFDPQGRQIAKQR